MAICSDIEVNPGDKALQSEFLARKDILWDRMALEDQATIDEEHARVRQLIKPRGTLAKRKVEAAA